MPISTQDLADRSIVPARRTRGDGALFSRAGLARQQPALKRILAGFLLLISFAGAVLWGGGGVAKWAALQPFIYGAVAACVVQLACTAVQWVFCDDWRNPFYVGALVFSTATTVMGYWPLAYVPLVAAIYAGAGPATTVGYYAPWLAGLILVAFALVLDILPERILTS